MKDVKKQKIYEIRIEKIQAVIEVGKIKQNAFSQYPENTGVIN